jgi:hypothetical protein
MNNLRRPTFGVLALLALVLWLGGYVRRGLWEPDEARYAYVAREMRVNGDWFVLHLHGEPYPDKPPLMFWLMNAASIFTGGAINGFSARLPSLLGAILALWATARLMERWRDTAAAWRAIAVLATSYLFWWQGGWGQIDMLLCGLEMMCLWCFFTASDPGRAGRYFGAYFFAGLAMLAKGPVGLGIPLAVYIAVTWAGGEPRLLKRGHWWWGIPLACASPGVWLLLAWKQGAPPEYFAAMFGAKSFGRVLQDQHAQAFYYYLLNFPLDFLPWTIFLPAAYRGVEPGPMRRRLVAWTLIVIGLFSLSVGKRHLYILLAFPGAAMLVAAGWDGLVSLTRRWQRVTGWIALGLIFTISLAETGLLAAAVSGLIKNADRVLGPNPAAPWTLLPCSLLMLGGGTVLIGWFNRDGLTRRWFSVFAGMMFVHWLLVGLLVLPALNATKAPLALAAEARAHLQPRQPIHVYQHQLAIIALYAERPGRYLQTTSEVEELITDGDYGIIVFDQKDWDVLAPQFAGRVRARPFRMGSKKLVWVDFPPAVAPQ